MCEGELFEWSETGWREGILRLQLKTRSEFVARLAEKLQHEKDFPTDTPPKLCHLIKKTASIIRGSLQDTPAEQLSHVNHFICTISEYLRYIERSRVAHTPWSMIQSTERFLKQQVGEDCHFIIRPQWSHNYGLNGEFVEVFRTSLRAFDWIELTEWEEELEDILNSRIYCISFPRIERLNPLMHANWGHEVGHIIADIWIQNNFDSIWQAEEPGIRERILSEVSRNPPPVDEAFRDTFIESSVADMTSRAMKTARQGLIELICDSIGIHLLGPAALASACEFSAPFSPDENPLRRGLYPPWRYRLRLMTRACSNDLTRQEVVRGRDNNDYPGSIIEPFYNWINNITRLVERTTDLDSIQSNIISREAYRVIDSNWETIQEESLRILPPDSSRAYRLIDHIPEIENLVSKLEKDIPPNDLGNWPDTTPSDYRDILNASWVYKIRKINEDSNWGTADDIEKTFRIILKAIEASFVQEVFGERLRQKDLL